MNKNFSQLEQLIGVKFNNQTLLANALIHRSYLNEVSHKLSLTSNERLEFLGDAVLELVISEWLYELFPNYPEGNLTNLRSNLVKRPSLAKVAKSFNLQQFILMSKGEIESGGKENPAILENTFEAIIGALYLDKDLNICKNFVRKTFEPHLKNLMAQGELKDYKGLLQEKIQEKIKEPPTYETVKEEGPDHSKTFWVAVYSQAQKLGEGTGKSKQEAEENAAKSGLNNLK